MGEKKVIVIFSIMLLLMAIGLETARIKYAFNTIKDSDYLAQYSKIESQSADKYNVVKKQGKEKYLLIYDSKETTSVTIKDNIEKTFGYIKKDYTTVDIKKAPSKFDEYTCVILDFEQLDNFSYFDSLFKYVDNGGNLIFAEVSLDNSNKFKSIYRDLGIYDKGSITDTKGIKLESDILIKGKGLTVKDAFDTNAIPVQLNKDCKVYAVSMDKTPLIWKLNRKKGQILYMNNQLLTGKVNRGLFIGILGSIGDSFIYPIVNTKNVQIDDFPAPLPDETLKSLYDEYGLDVPDFYKEIWWPDMLEISKKYGIKYTGYIIETYTKTMKPDFSQVRATIKSDDMLYFGRELIKSGGEFGLHGYNHQPLALDNGFVKDKSLGYTPWANTTNMRESLTEVQSYVNSVFPDYKLRSYVAPSNIVSEPGRLALKDSIPSMKIICAVYEADPTISDTKQDYGINKEDGLIDLPRMTYGYKMDEYTKWLAYSGISTYGIFSHFVHPDDLLDSARSKDETWAQLKKGFEEDQSEIATNFSWLNNEVVSQSAANLVKYVNEDVVFDNTNSEVNGYCNNFKKDAYFILRTEKSIGKSTGCTANKIDDGVYLIHAQNPEFNIELGEK